MNMLAFSDIFIHLVWCISDKSPKLDNVTRQLVEKFIAESGERFGYEYIAVASLDDHIHLLAKTLPGVAAGLLVELLKKEIITYLTGKLAMKSPPEWDNCYGIVSVSKAHLESVTEYIHSQVSRHKDGKINKTLERMKK